MAYQQRHRAAGDMGTAVLIPTGLSSLVLIELHEKELKGASERTVVHSLDEPDRFLRNPPFDFTGVFEKLSNPTEENTNGTD